MHDPLPTDLIKCTFVNKVAAPEAARERFSKLICIETEGAFVLEDEFVAAVAEAEREVEICFGSNHAHMPNQRA